MSCIPPHGTINFRGRVEREFKRKAARERRRRERVKKNAAVGVGDGGATFERESTPRERQCHDTSTTEGST